MGKHEEMHMISYLVKTFTSECHFFPLSISLPIKGKSFEIEFYIYMLKKTQSPNIKLQCNIKLDIQKNSFVNVHYFT